MSDPNKTMPPRFGAGAPRPTVKDKVESRLLEAGVPAQVVVAKIDSTWRWWAATAVFMFFALGFSAGLVFVALKRDMTILLAIILGIPIGVCLLGALFAASQASGEATKAFLATIFRINREVRRPSSDQGDAP